MADNSCQEELNAQLQALSKRIDTLEVQSAINFLFAETIGKCVELITKPLEALLDSTIIADELKSMLKLMQSPIDAVENISMSIMKGEFPKVSASSSINSLFQALVSLPIQMATMALSFQGFPEALVKNLIGQMSATLLNMEGRILQLPANGVLALNGYLQSNFQLLNNELSSLLQLPEIQSALNTVNGQVADNMNSLGIRVRDVSKKMMNVKGMDQLLKIDTQIRALNTQLDDLYKVRGLVEPSIQQRLDNIYNSMTLLLNYADYKNLQDMLLFNQANIPPVPTPESLISYNQQAFDELDKTLDNLGGGLENMVDSLSGVIKKMNNLAVCKTSSMNFKK